MTKQIKDLTEQTAPNASDVVAIDQASDDVTKKVKLSNIPIAAGQVTSGTMATARLGSGTADESTALHGDQTYKPIMPDSGWTIRSEAWTRTGNHTFTIVGDVTTTYRKGVKVRYKDGGNFEYGVIGASSYSAPNTTVTLITNTDFSMAAATITDTAISYIVNPEGFPDYFNYSPSWTADGVNPTLGNGTLAGVWRADGAMCRATVQLYIGSTSNIGESTYRISLPVNSITTVLNVGSSVLLDINTVAYYEGISLCSGANITFVVGTTIVQHNSPITFATGDYIWADVGYLF